MLKYILYTVYYYACINLLNLVLIMYFIKYSCIQLFCGIHD